MTASFDINTERSYHIEEYTPEWVERFESIKKVLKEIWTDAVAIEHVGSTAVPGMKAKPIIDVLIIYKEWEDFTVQVEKMRALGYVAEENVWSNHSWLFYKVHPTEKGPKKIENIHFLIEGSPKIDQFIDIRDYLRTHPDRARAYGDLKQELFKQFPDDYFSYRDGKQEFLAETEQLTREWVKSGRK